jgi:hypothetical protein
MTFISKALMYIVSVAAVDVLFASIMGMTMWLVLTIFRFAASEFSRTRSLLADDHGGQHDKSN